MMTVNDTNVDVDQAQTFTPWFGFVLDDVPQPGPWHRGARCRNAPSTLFFPERGDDTSVAKRICAGCGVLEQCRAYALDAGPLLKGIWGGTSERERRHLRSTS